MPTPAPSKTPLIDKKRVLILVAFLLLLYVVVPRLGNFSESFTALQRADVWLVALAAGVLVLTYFLAAGIYYLLAFRSLSYRSVALVQLASTFTNRLLPAGIGGPTLYVQFFRKQRHTLPQALAAISANGLLSFGAHWFLLLGGLLVTGGTALPPIKALSLSSIGLILAGIAGLAAIALLFGSIRSKLFRFLKNVVSSLAAYRQRPVKLFTAFGLACLFTVSYVAIFCLCAAALNVHLSVMQLFLVFTIGVIAGTATPTPGGLVGAEAGLAGGLISYGVEPSAALAVALLYRFLTYWLPLLPAFATFAAIRKLYL